MTMTAQKQENKYKDAGIGLLAIGSVLLSLGTAMQFGVSAGMLMLAGIAIIGGATLLQGEQD